MFFVKKWIVTPPIKSLLSSPLTLLVCLTLIRGLIYLSIFPPFLAPDEAAHFEAIRFIGQGKKWPTSEVYLTTPMHSEMPTTFEQFRIWRLVGLYSPVNDLNVTDNLFIHYYPPQIAGSEVVADSYLMLYHISLAPLSAAVASFDLVTQVYVLRFTSVLFAALTVVVAWFTMRSVFPTEKIFAMAVGSFIVFWPMHSHVTASINAEAFAELIASLFFLVLAQTYRKGISWFRGAVMMTLLGLAFLTKPTLFFLLPTLAAALLLYLGDKLKWNKLMMSILIGGLVASTWLGSLFLYKNAGHGHKLFSLFSIPLRFPLSPDQITFEAWTFYLKSLNLALVSFGGLFGWSNIHIPWTWVRVLAVFCFLIMLGVLAFIYRDLLRRGGKENKLSHLQRKLLVIFLVAILFSLIGVTAPVVATLSPTWAVHSRYYFPVVIPIALYFFLGFRQLMPTRIRHLTLPIWLTVLIFFDSAVIFLVLVPYIYG